MSDSDKSQWRRRGFLKATGVAGLAAGFVSVGTAQPGRSPGPKDGEVLVGVSQAVGTPRDVVEEHTPEHARVAHENRGLGYAAVKFSENARQRFMERIRDEEGVKYAELNATHEALYTPNDPQYGSQYAPGMVNADQAWDTTLGASSVTVAVVDTGVQYDHPDLEANFRSDPGYDFVDADGDPYPDVPSDEYHGTHVSGIAAGVTDNGTGTAGVSESTLINGRALDETGRGSTSDIADAVEWAADQGADVINLSLGGGGYPSTMKNAVGYATNNGALVVAAAGNDGQNSVSYPAAYSECLAVSALDSDGSLASYSNYGSEIELAAPGTSVLATTTEARGSYENLWGTSMATPVVSGCAGLTLAQWSLTNSELRAHLKDTADDVGLSSDEQGSGRVDAYDAVSTDPSGDGGGGGSSTSATVSDSLSSSYDYDDWTWAWEYGDPSQVVVELDGPADADFDLYVNTGTTQNASPSNYDYASYSTDSQESITVDDPDTSTEMQIDVDSYSGSGSYDLTITEYQ